MSSASPIAPPLVVVVNDDESQRQPLCALLERHGLRVSAHATVPAALLAMGETQPALVITDLCMPEIDGVRFCRLMRSSAYRSFNDIPVLVASATYAGADTESIMVELGANDFLRLPAGPEAFLQRVDRLLQHARPATGPRVLLVAPEEAALLESAFAANGYRVLVAATLAEAGPVLATSSCAVAVLDLDQTGLDLAQLSALATRWPETAFFTLTAAPDPDLAVRAMRAGASAHLRRPYAPEYLCSLAEMARREKSLLRVQNLLERRTRELRRSEQELQAVVESTGQAFLLLGPDGRVELFNQAAARLAAEVFGRTLRMGQTLVEMLGLEFALATLNNVRAALNGEVMHHEVELHDSTGQAHWLAATYAPVPGPDGAINRVCFNAQDITERRFAEDALRESEARFRGMADNAPVAGGSGITANLFHKVRSYGVDVVTLGDHIYRKADIVPTLQSSERIVRPANLASTAAGRRFTVVTTAAGISVGVFSLLGRIYMNLPADDPFAAADWVLASLPDSVRVCVCDMHAEATSEKVAIGHWLDGRCSMIVGTHTHIPTADARILPGGSAVITDLGMCGPYDSVLGRRKDRVLKHMTTNMPHSFEIATGDVRLCGALAEIDPETGRALSMERIEIHGENADQAYDSDDKTPDHQKPE